MANTFTPEQIAQILEEFFKTVGTRQYIGARYVPIFGRKDETSIEWENSKPYESLTVVLYQGNSYTSRQYVPEGVEITNQEFWAQTGNYNGQIELYRQETARALQVAEGAQENINNLGALLPEASFSEASTVHDAIEANASNISDNAEAIAEINDLLPKEAFNDKTVKQTIDDLVTINEPDGTVQGIQKFLPDYPDLEAKGYGNIICVHDGALESHLYTAGHNWVADGNYDLCEAISIMNSYLVHADDFIYDQSYGGIMYEGEYASPTPVVSTAHMTSGKLHIDCNTFTQLCGHGITFSNSPYAPNNDDGHSTAYHRMFDPTAEAVKPYWFYGLDPDSPTGQRPTGYGRMIAHAFAKFLFDVGKLGFIQNVAEVPKPGAIMFSGNTDGNFLGISHCYFIGGFIGSRCTESANDYITVESNSTEGQPLAPGILTSTMTNFNRVRCKAWYMPPWISGDILNMQPAVYHPANADYSSVNLSTAAFTWTPSATRGQGARVMCLTSQRDAATNLTIEAFKIDDPDTVLMTRSVSISMSGTYIIYLPMTWGVRVSSTDNATWNITTNVCTSDKQIRIPARAMTV